MVEPATEPPSGPAAPEVTLRSSTRMATAVGSTAAAVVFALLLGTTRSLTAPAALLIIGAGIAAWYLWFSLPVRVGGEWPAARCPGISVWIALGSLFGVVELTAYFMGDDHEHPTFSRLVDPLLSSPFTRALAALGWLLWGRRLANLAPRSPAAGSGLGVAEPTSEVDP